MTLKNETVILVDTNDREIGQQEKIAAHREGNLHRAFSVFIFRHRSNTIELLLQKRHPHKYHCGGLWTNTCCGHPRPDEDVRQGAERRLNEELGLKIPLTRVGAFVYTASFDNGLIENEYDHVFIGFSKDEMLFVNPTEISEIRWVHLKSLQAEYEEYPERFTPWFKKALDSAVKAVSPTQPQRT